MNHAQALEVANQQAAQLCLLILPGTFAISCIWLTIARALDLVREERRERSRLRRVETEQCRIRCRLSYRRLVALREAA